MTQRKASTKLNIIFRVIACIMTAEKFLC